MAMRSWVSRGSVTRLMDSANRGAFSRFFSDKGRVLSEEEQAKENVYIQVGTSTFTLFGSGRISRSIFLTVKYYFVFVRRLAENWARRGSHPESIRWVCEWLWGSRGAGDIPTTCISSILHFSLLFVVKEASHIWKAKSSVGSSL